MIRARPPRALIASLAFVTVTAAFTGVAYAYWRTTGSGSGSTSAATIVSLTLSPATPGAALAPGGLTDVVLSASNPNAATVRIGTLSLDTTQGGTTGYAVDAGHSACTLSTLSFTTQTNGGNGWTVPAKAAGVNGALSVTLTNALSMSTSASNACQGASFTVYLIAS